MKVLGSTELSVIVRRAVIAVIVVSVIITGALPSFAASKESRNAKSSATLEATWYTGDVLGFTGAGGRLEHAECVALNNAQRKSLGIIYGDKVYLKFPKRHRNLNGWYKVKDTGCARGVVDVFYRSKGSVPCKFKSEGRVNRVKMYKKKLKAMKHKISGESYFPQARD
jgi:3D (Asp-Asp-Asp) domain-containing protein